MSNGKFCNNPKCSMHISDRLVYRDTLLFRDEATGKEFEIRRFLYINSSLDKEYHFCEVCNEAITMTYKGE